MNIFSLCVVGISQRDTNYYDFYNEINIRDTIIANVDAFWESKIKPKWELADCASVQHLLYIRTRVNGEASDTFDILLTRDLVRAHILDFNPYAPQTDTLLFTYDELHDISLNRTANDGKNPIFKIINSKTHPAAISNAPAYQHNMVPFEALSFSSGMDIEEFSEAWKEGIQESMHD